MSSRAVAAEAFRLTIDTVNPDDLPIDRKLASVLHALGKYKARVRLALFEIAIEAEVSRGTAQSRLSLLVSAGLVERHRERSGFSITPAGRSFLLTLPPELLDRRNCRKANRAQSGH